MDREAPREALPWPLIWGHTPSPASAWPPDKNPDRDQPREPLNSSLLLLVPPPPPIFPLPWLPPDVVPLAPACPCPQYLLSANSLSRPGPDRPARMRRRLTPRPAPSPPPPAPAQLARARRALPSVRADGLAGGRAPSGRTAALLDRAPPPLSALHLRAPRLHGSEAPPPCWLPTTGSRTPSSSRRAPSRWLLDLGVPGSGWAPVFGCGFGWAGVGNPKSPQRHGEREPRAHPSGRSRPMAGEDGSTTWSGRRM